MATEAEAAAAAAAGNTQAWHTGIDSETIGLWKNKGWNTESPVEIAKSLTTAYREAERFIGAPASQLVRLPADPVKDADMMKTVWQRLGTPQEAKEYDFPVFKDKDGKVTNTTLEGALREGLFKLNVPKGMASEVGSLVNKYLVDTETAEIAEATAALATEKDALVKNWGLNQAQNLVISRNAAAALGVTADELNALEETVGYARVMEMFRVIGTKIGEDKFIRSVTDGGSGVMSKDQAAARVMELKSDQAWVKRYQSGDKAAFRELQDLLKITTEGRETRL